MSANQSYGAQSQPQYAAQPGQYPPGDKYYAAQVYSQRAHETYADHTVMS